MSSSRRILPVPWLAVGLLSATALAYQVLLTRLFSLVHWHHLVGMVISLALLGYGASGSFLALLRHRLERQFRPLFIGSALLFALGSLFAFELARQLPLNPLVLPWDSRQVLYLVAVYGLAAVPFFGVANCIGLALWRYRGRSHQVYAVDLAGSGLGAAAVVGLLYLLHPGPALGVLAVLAGLCVLVAAWELRLAPVPGLALGLVLSLAGAIAWHWIDWEVPGAPYKDLSLSLSASGAEVDNRVSDPFGVVTVLRNQAVPLRYAPGLSLSAGALPPVQHALFIDGDAAGAITRFDGKQVPAHLSALPSALPYRLLEQPRVLVIEPGGGDPVLQALGQGARQVTAVSLQSRLVDLLGGRYREFNGGLWQRAEVEPVRAEPRSFIEHSDRRFDLIQLDLVGGGGIGGLQAQVENHDYTQEAFAAYLERLSGKGMLAITRWAQLPPRESLRLVATAILALEGAGVEQPEQHIALVRSWRTFTLVVSRAPFRPEDSEVIRRFCRDLGFDPVWFPGIQAAETNRYHRLDRPRYYEGVKALLGDRRDEFLAGYPFRIEPVTDDRPYFHRFSRLASLPQLLDLPAGTGFGQVDWGYGFLAATLAQAAVLAGVLILLPLLFLRDRGSRPALRWRTLLYFALIGLAFLFVEIAFIQRFALFLGHPLHATAVVLGGFLVCAGAGSWLSRSGDDLSKTLRRVVLGIGLLAAGYLWLLPGMLDASMAWPLAAKTLLVLLLIAPLALLMGMPFPLGLALLGARAPGLLPWAWGINGSFSVVSAVAATLISMELGFSGLLLLALILYLPLPWVFGRRHVG